MRSNLKLVINNPHKKAEEKQFFEKGAIAFKNTDTKNPEKDKIIKLEQKLQTKNEVLSELMEEHVKLKKSLGEI
mgnify:CR=1 FL=1